MKTSKTPVIRNHCPCRQAYSGQEYLSFAGKHPKNLKIIEEGRENGYIYTVAPYMGEAGELPDKQKFMKTAATGLEFTEEKVMTLIEQSKLELYDKARQEALHDVALNLLMLKMDIKKISEATGLFTRDVEALKRQIQ